MRGRKRQPKAVHEAKGRPDHRKPLGSQADSAEPARDAAPRGLPAKARAIWNALAPELASLNLLRKPDEPAFQRYCQLVAEWQRAMRHCEDDGAVYVSRSKHVSIKRVNPWFLVMTRLERHLVDLEDRFGLSPRARQQILLQLAAKPATEQRFPLGEPDQPRTDNAETPLGILNPPSRLH